MKKIPLLLFLSFMISVSVHAQKVIGGNEAAIDAYPWMAGLVYDGNLQCGATLIGDSWLLTAAHCVDGLTSELLESTRVRINHHSNISPNAHSELMEIEKVFIHPESSNQINGSDIALIRIKTPSNFAPCYLPTSDDFDLYQEDNDALVLGWGVMNEFNETATELQEAQVQIYNHDLCKENYTEIQVDVSDSIVCAGYTASQSPAGAAKGDSGGPLMIRDEGIWKNIGIVSSGYRNITTDKFPGLFIKTISHLDWIENTIVQYDGFLPSDRFTLEQDIVFSFAEKELSIRSLGQRNYEDLKVTIFNMMGQNILRTTLDFDGLVNLDLADESELEFLIVCLEHEDQNMIRKFLKY